MAHEQTLRGFLALLSDTTDFTVKPGAKPGHSGAANGHASTKDLDAFLHQHGTKVGASLTIPSLSSDGAYTGTPRASEATPLPTAVLKSIIKAGNPFPPKTSYAKGKKKLQKRRNSSQLKPGAVANIEEEDQNGLSSNSAKTSTTTTKAEENHVRMFGRPLTYHSKSTTFDEVSESSSQDLSKGELYRLNRFTVS